MSGIGDPAPSWLRSASVDESLQRRLVRGWVRERAAATVLVWGLLAVGVLVVILGRFDVLASVLAVVVGGGVGLLDLRRRAAQRHPLGSVIAAGLDADALCLVLDGVDRRLHLSRVELIGERGRVVRLRLLGTTMLLPRELFDVESLSTLADGAPAPPQDGGLLRDVENLAPGRMSQEDVADMRRLVWRLASFRRWTIGLGLVVAALAVAGIIVDGGADSWVLLLGLAALLVARLAAVVRARRGIPPAGAAMFGDLDEARWVVATSTSLLAVPLEELSHAERYRGLVRFHWRRPVPHTAFPLHLLPAAAQARLLAGPDAEA